MTQLFANNAKGTLDAGINASATSIVLSSGQGAAYPSPTAGDYFKLTLTQSTAETSWEIVTIVGRTTDTLTVGIPGSASSNVAGRGADSTSAASWSGADKAEHRFTVNDIVLRTNGTLTTPTITLPTVTDYIESIVANGTVGASKTLALTSGTMQTATLTASTPCTFTMPAATSGKSFTLKLVQASSGMTTATFTSVKWPGGVAPTVSATASAVDIFGFVCFDSIWYGMPSLAFA